MEKQKALMGCQEDSSCLVEVANNLGVDILVNGSVGKLGSTYLLSATILDPVKAVAEKTFQRTISGTEDKLIFEAKAMGQDIGRHLVETRVRALDEKEKEKAKLAQAAPKAPEKAPEAPKAGFAGAIPGFPYGAYPAPKLDQEAAARYLRAHP